LSAQTGTRAKDGEGVDWDSPLRFPALPTYSYWLVRFRRLRADGHALLPKTRLRPRRLTGIRSVSSLASRTKGFIDLPDGLEYFVLPLSAEDSSSVRKDNFQRQFNLVVILYGRNTKVAVRLGESVYQLRHTFRL